MREKKKQQKKKKKNHPLPVIVSREEKTTQGKVILDHRAIKQNQQFLKENGISAAHHKLYFTKVRERHLAISREGNYCRRPLLKPAIWNFICTIELGVGGDSSSPVCPQPPDTQGYTRGMRCASLMCSSYTELECASPQELKSCSISDEPSLLL